MNKKDFKTFLKNSGVIGIRNVTLSYAYEADTTTFEMLAEKFGITRRCVRRCIEYCIINCEVNYDVAMLIKEKSHRNQIKHMKENSVWTTSDKYYGKIMQKRLNFIKNLPNEKVIEFAYLYMANPKMSCKEIAKELNLSSKELNVVLVGAITNNLVEEGVIQLMEVNSLMKSKTTSEFIRKSEYFKKLEALRKSGITK